MQELLVFRVIWHRWRIAIEMNVYSLRVDPLGVLTLTPLNMHIECVIPALICLRNYVQMKSHAFQAEGLLAVDGMK